MSGGSYEYISYKLEDTANRIDARHDAAHIRALASLIRRIADVMYEIEWADSGDISWTDKIDEQIRVIVSPADELREAIAAAEHAYKNLGQALKRVAP